jgi:hypothetical protein
VVLSLQEQKVPRVADVVNMPELGNSCELRARQMGNGLEEESMNGNAGEKTRKVASG